MANLINRIRRDNGIWIGGFIFFQLGVDAGQPLVKDMGWARIEGWKRANNASFTLSDNKLWARNKKQRRANDGDAQITF